MSLEHVDEVRDHVRVPGRAAGWTRHFRKLERRLAR